MDKREPYVNRIINILTYVQLEVANRNSVRLFDIASHAEDFYRLLLNKVFGYELINLNVGSVPSKAVDLGDQERGIAYQVTSDNSKAKIKKTVGLFCANELHKQYPSLKIFLVTGRSERKGELHQGDFTFNLEEDVHDVSYLLRHIKTLEAKQIEEILLFLESEIVVFSRRDVRVPEKADFDSYFMKFLDEEKDPTVMLAKGQPNLADCRDLFSDDYYKLVYHIYNVQFYTLAGLKDGLADHLRDKEEYKAEFSSYADIETRKHVLPGGVTRLLELGALRPGKLNYYSLKFVRHGEEFGVSVRLFVFLNGRWVFFPRPWDIVDAVHKLRQSKGLRRLVYFLRWLKFGRTYTEQDEMGIIATIYIIRELIHSRKT